MGARTNWSETLRAGGSCLPTSDKAEVVPLSGVA